MSFYPTENREFLKNCKKKFKKLKNTNYGFFSSQNMLGIALKERK